MNRLPLILLIGGIGWILQRSAGHYDPAVLLYTGFFFGALALSVQPPWRVTPLTWGLCAGLIAACFLAWARIEPRIVYATGSDWRGTFDLLQSTRIAILLGMGGLALARPRWLPTGLLVFAVVSLTAFSLVPVLSPRPWIDVFVNNTAAADFMLAGKNPYSQAYVDIYQGRYGYQPGFFYPPGLLLWIAPARWIFGDIRYAFVAAHGVIAAGLWVLSRKGGRAAALPVLLWLAFPVVFFVLEQAWVDTLLVAPATLMLVFLERRRWVALALCSALAITVKQYGFIFSLLVGVEVLRTHGPKAGLRYGAWTAAAALAITLPFVIADPAGFWQMTVGNLASQAIREDALTATAWLLLEQGIALPALLQAGFAIAALAGAVVWVWRGGRSLGGAARVASGALFAYGVSFFFGKFAFCNYHAWLAALAILLFATSLRPQSR